MKLNQKIKLYGIGLLAMAGSLMVVNCGSRDTQNLPNKIKVNAVVRDGYHVHAKVEFYASNPIKFICTGILGEGLKGKTDIYNNISPNGVEFEIKKTWPGVCSYMLVYIEVACTKTQSFPYSHDNSFESVLIGMLDTVTDASRSSHNTILSNNRILDNSLFIKVKGSGSRFWGCKDDCENEEKFGIDSTNKTLTINCSEG